VTTSNNKLKTFFNRWLRTIKGTKWSEILSNIELCEFTGEKATIFGIRMRNWRCICHNLRKGMNTLRTKLWAEIRSEPDGQEDRSKPGRGPF